MDLEEANKKWKELNERIEQTSRSIEKAQNVIHKTLNEKQKLYNELETEGYAFNKAPKLKNETWVKKVARKTMLDTAKLTDQELDILYFLFDSIPASDIMWENHKEIFYLMKDAIIEEMRKRKIERY